MAVVIGVGFRAATTTQALRAALDDALDRCGESWPAVTAVATTVRRAGHPALDGLGVPVEFHDPAALAAVHIPNPSGVVAALAATASVAEAAARLSSDHGDLVLAKRCEDGVCTAVARLGTALRGGSEVSR